MYNKLKTTMKSVNSDKWSKSAREIDFILQKLRIDGRFQVRILKHPYLLRVRFRPEERSLYLTYILTFNVVHLFSSVNNRSQLSFQYISSVYTEVDFSFVI